jgi:Tol biopolymer transport system component
MFILASALAYACNSHDGYKLLNEDVPEKVPQVFFQKHISNEDRYEQYLSFSKSGNELYLSVTDQNWRYIGILYSELEKDHWTQLDTVEFTREGRDGGEAFLFDQSLYFVSFRHNKKVRQTDIYKVDKNGDNWTEATRLSEPLNSTANEWHPSLTANGDMYFATERFNDRFQADIYKSIFVDGHFKEPVKLSDAINSEYNDGDPMISPDESFLIFHSERPGGFGGHDLYISFRTDDGSWTKAKNMGPAINSEQLEFGPSLSPDGKFFFFTRRESFQTTIPSKIYWVSASIIEELND